mmetsp:Transcript_9933/g.18778  ORF Transcript_9933/g.18778 Transcript_9933/m.18778 type:complete len:1168 (-) Transcript_9933:1926-5429(-)
MMSLFLQQKKVGIVEEEEEEEEGEDKAIDEGGDSSIDNADNCEDYSDEMDGYQEAMEAQHRPLQFDGHFDGPLIDLETRYAPMCTPSVHMQRLLSLSEDSDAFKCRVCLAENVYAIEPDEEDEFAYNSDMDESNSMNHTNTDATDAPDADEEPAGELSSIVRLRWAQVHFQSKDHSAFVTAESAIIRMFKRMLEVFQNGSGDLMKGFEMLRKEVDVQVQSAQVFVDPREALGRDEITRWIPIRGGDNLPLCFTETLEDYAFAFHNKPTAEKVHSKGVLIRDDNTSMETLRRIMLEETHQDPPESTSSSKKLKALASILEKTNFSVREISYSVFPPVNDAETLSQDDAAVPLGKFCIDVPGLKIRVSSMAFFNILGIVRDLLLVMPSPDHTAIIKHRNFTNEKVQTESYDGWVGPDVCEDDDLSQASSPASSDGGYEYGENNVLNQNGAQQPIVENVEAALGSVDEIMVSELDQIPQHKERAQSVDSRLHLRATGSSQRRRRGASVLSEGDGATATVMLMEDRLTASQNDPKVLKELVNAILDTEDPKAKRWKRKNELVYTIGHTDLILLQENKTTPHQESDDMKKKERVRMLVTGIRGSHLFVDDGSTKVQLSVEDLRVIDCNASRPSATGATNLQDNFQDIVRGRVGTDGASNTKETVPFLRVDASTRRHILIGDYKVNVYDMLQLLFYPGALSYRLSVHLTYEIATFLVHYFNNEGDDEDDTLPASFRMKPALSHDSIKTGTDVGEKQEYTEEVELAASAHVIRSGWILKRGRTDISWKSGRVRRNFCQIRFRFVRQQAPMAYIEYYRNELETRLRMAPRGSINVKDIRSVSFTHDLSAPPRALDLMVSKTEHSGDTTRILTDTYTFAPEVTLKGSTQTDSRRICSVEWVAALRPLLGHDVISGELLEILDDSEDSAHLLDVTNASAKIVSAHLHQEIKFQLPPSEEELEQTGLEWTGAEELPTHRAFRAEGQYRKFIKKNEGKQYLLSKRRASALGLMTREAMRLASGELIDLVYVRYVRTSPIRLSLGCQGFPIIPKLVNKNAQSAAIIIHLRIFTWQKFFKHLRQKLLRNLIRSLLSRGSKSRQRKEDMNMQNSIDNESKSPQTQNSPSRRLFKRLPFTSPSAPSLQRKTVKKDSDHEAEDADIVGATNSPEHKRRLFGKWT